MGCSRDSSCSTSALGFHTGGSMKSSDATGQQPVSGSGPAWGRGMVRMLKSGKQQALTTRYGYGALGRLRGFEPQRHGLFDRRQRCLMGIAMGHATS